MMIRELRVLHPQQVAPVVDWLDNPDCMAMVFAHEAQSSLAHTLYKMKTRRARLLGLTNGI
jgi:hypothetical protein